MSPLVVAAQNTGFRTKEGYPVSPTLMLRLTRGGDEAGGGDGGTSGGDGGSFPPCPGMLLDSDGVWCLDSETPKFCIYIPC